VTSWLLVGAQAHEPKPQDSGKSLSALQHSLDWICPPVAVHFTASVASAGRSWFGALSTRLSEVSEGRSTPPSGGRQQTIPGSAIFWHPDMLGKTPSGMVPAGQGVLVMTQVPPVLVQGFDPSAPPAPPEPPEPVAPPEFPPVPAAAPPVPPPSGDLVLLPSVALPHETTAASASNDTVTTECSRGRQVMLFSEVKSGSYCF
jgi:hypothetical protein